MLISEFEVRLSEMLAIVEKGLFINSLIGTTIQDGGKKERSNDVILYYNSNFKSKIRK